MKKLCAGLLMLMGLLAIADSADAQRRQCRRGCDRAPDLPLRFEARLDAGIPVGDSGDALETGVGFGFDAALEIAPTFAVYGGYSNFSFDVEDTLGSGEVDSDGWSLGGRLQLGTGGAVATPYALLGALFHDDDTGLEAGLGTEYPVSDRLFVTPQVRYRTVGDLDYLTLGLGVLFKL